MPDYGPLDSPCEVHNRVYDRVIEPLRQDLDGDVYHQLTRTIPATFVAPLNLATYPTTFGPEDENPFYSLRVEAKTVDHISFLLPIAGGPETKRILEAAFNASRRDEKTTVLQRLGKTISGVRELRVLRERFTPPRIVKQLFLPSSRYFMSGFASVGCLSPPQLTPLDAICATWRLEPELGQAIKAITMKAQSTPPATLDKVWERWSSLDKEVIDWSSLKISSPLFPARDNEPPVISYDECTTLLASSTPLLDGAVPRRPSPSMVWDVFVETQDIDPYSTAVLDEFDAILFEELSATTRRSDSSRRTETTRVNSSWPRPEGPIEPWKHSSLIGDYSSDFYSYTSSDPSAKTPIFARQWSGHHEFREHSIQRHYDQGNQLLDPRQYAAGHWEEPGYAGGETDQDTCMWDQFDDLAKPADQFTGYPGSSYRGQAERFSPRHQTHRDQHWDSPSQGHETLQSPASLSARAPLASDFQRHGLDWRPPLQTSSPSSLASPIKMQQPPTPDSREYLHQHAHGHRGPARTLTYDDAPYVQSSSQARTGFGPEFWHAHLPSRAECHR